MTEDVFELKPRWKGAPPICIKENRPAFETEKALKDWSEKHSPSIHVAIVAQCKFCGWYHCMDTVKTTERAEFVKWKKEQEEKKKKRQSVKP